MRVILSGGGTGGHIYPAVAIGQAIKKKWPEAEILYIGTEKGLESKIVPQAGFNMQSIDVVGWQREISVQALCAAWKTMKSIRQASKYIRKFAPDLVVGTGGYVCLPVVWAAARQGIPTVLHEQNAMPGLTNKILARKANYVLLTFPEAARRFPDIAQGKIRVTGLPVRPQILNIGRAEGLAYFGFADNLPVLLTVGGSRGAKSINTAMLELYRTIQEERIPLQVIHLTGQTGFEQVKEQLRQAGIDLANCGNIIIKPYLHEMEYALACADLCVGRAGAAFLSEMTAKGIPGILIPYPYAAENHQEYNARSLEKRGAAKVILDQELTGTVLAETVLGILRNEKERAIMARKSLEAGKPEAIEKILEVVQRIAER